ncbi:MAG: Uncharacterized protein FD169_1832 [Bacillota bacterium]|nr:MAG: Uncharacterized protein FD169_1832 [Bacillota bacterium]
MFIAPYNILEQMPYTFFMELFYSGTYLYLAHSGPISLAVFTQKLAVRLVSEQRNGLAPWDNSQGAKYFVQRGRREMRIICTYRDIEVLEQHNALPTIQLLALRGNLTQNLSWICESVTDEVNLEDHGPIFLLEPGDNTRGMAPAGIPSHIGGLLGVIPEYVEEVTLDSKIFWKVLVVLGNSYAPTYWIPVGMDPELDQHLNKYLDPISEQPKSPLEIQPDEEDFDADWI